MNIRKRGDHLFATGLSKTIRDVSIMIAAEIGNYSEGRVLLETVSRCTRDLTGEVFHAVIDKGRPVRGDDPHSLIFGRDASNLKLQIQSLVFALRFRREVEGRDRATLSLANRQVATAKHHSMLTVGRFFDSVMDDRVAERLIGTAVCGEIQAAQASLENVRREICRCIARM